MKIFDWIKSKIPKRQTVAYFRVVLDSPICEASEKEPEKPWIKVLGMPKGQAVGSVNWGTIPHLYRRPLEREPFSLEVKWSEIKEWVI